MISIEAHICTNHYTSFSQEWVDNLKSIPVQKIYNFSDITLLFFEWLNSQKIRSSFKRVFNNHFQVNDKIGSVITDPLFEITDHDYRCLQTYAPKTWHDTFALLVTDLFRMNKKNHMLKHTNVYHILRRSDTPLFYIKRIYIDDEFVPIMYCQYFMKET